jgi:N-acetylglucosamine-6-phosphate deacetylase
MFSIKGRIVTPLDVVDAYLMIDGARIADIRCDRPEHDKVYDFSGFYVLPGFIDLHTHGVGNYEPLDKGNLVGMAQLKARYGTTSFLPTGAAMTTGQYINLGISARDAIVDIDGTGAKIPGVHLEGPYINPKSSGAMAQSTRRPISVAETRKYVEKIGDTLKVMTFSPELEGGIELTKYLSKNGIVPALGHSVAEGWQLKEFVDAGLSHVAHMYNAFVPSGEKEPGVLNAGLLEHILLNEALTCEFICDMQHVAPEYIVIASKLLGDKRFVAVTDSVYGAGRDDGIYAFPNGDRYRIADGVARLHDGELSGCLAGSVLTMNRAFANLVEKCGIANVLAVKYTSTNAARVIGIEDETGSIERGKCADIAVLDESYNCAATFINGKLVYKK